MLNRGCPIPVDRDDLPWRRVQLVHGTGAAEPVQQVGQNARPVVIVFDHNVGAMAIGAHLLNGIRRQQILNRAARKVVAAEDSGDE
jgi:hypothetical protein